MPRTLPAFTQTAPAMSGTNSGGSDNHSPILEAPTSPKRKAQSPPDAPGAPAKSRKTEARGQVMQGTDLFNAGAANVVAADAMAATHAVARMDLPLPYSSMQAYVQLVDASSPFVAVVAELKSFAMELDAPRRLRNLRGSILPLLAAYSKQFLNDRASDSLKSSPFFDELCGWGLFMDFYEIVKQFDTHGTQDHARRQVLTNSAMAQFCASNGDSIESLGERAIAKHNAALAMLVFKMQQGVAAKEIGHSPKSTLLKYLSMQLKAESTAKQPDGMKAWADMYSDIMELGIDHFGVLYQSNVSIIVYGVEQTFRATCSALPAYVLDVCAVYHKIAANQTQSPLEDVRQCYEKFQASILRRPGTPKFVLKFAMDVTAFRRKAEDGVDVRSIAGMFVHGHDCGELTMDFISPIWHYMHRLDAAGSPKLELEMTGMRQGRFLCYARPYHFELDFIVGSDRILETQLELLLKSRVFNARVKQGLEVVSAVQAYALLAYVLLNSEFGDALNSLFVHGYIYKDGMSQPIVTNFDPTRPPQAEVLQEMLRRADLQAYNLKEAMDKPAVIAVMQCYPRALRHCMELFAVSTDGLEQLVKTVQQLYSAKFMLEFQQHRSHAVAAVQAAKSLGSDLVLLVEAMDSHVLRFVRDKEEHDGRLDLAETKYSRDLMALKDSEPLRFAQMQQATLKAGMGNALAVREHANETVDRVFTQVAHRVIVEEFKAAWVHPYFGRV